MHDRLGGFEALERTERLAYSILTVQPKMSKATATGTATKTKKPSVTIQTNPLKTGLPSASPSSATKRLPGSAQTQNGATTNGGGRPARRPPRVNTRTNTLDNVGNGSERKNIPPEPFVLNDRFILRKHKGRPPSLIVHLHPGYWRFDQQDGNFSYQTPEMRPFLEHMKKGTIPHDFLEEFRREGVKFYDGCLMVKIFDHRRSATTVTLGTHRAPDDEEPFSIHNHNQFITPSPYATHPYKDQAPAKNERPKSLEKENIEPLIKKEQDSTTSARNRVGQPVQFMKILRPTELSRSADLTLDFIATDPKAKKQKAVQPPTPGGTIPATPTGERPPPLKKQKTRIDPKDHLEYEARIINATAPPLYLEPARDAAHAEQIREMLQDPLCIEPPASPKSRKRTIAELAADDAAAKEQERFMLIMDAKTSGTAAANATGVDPQAGSTQFQPRFEKFNALDNIKRDLSEKKQRENEKRLADDEVRRNQHQQQQEEEAKRRMQRDAIEQRKQQAILRQQAQQTVQQRQNQDPIAVQQQQQPGAGQAPRRNMPNQNQPSAIPHNMQNQMMAQASSPIVRQGTPLMASSPATAARPMVRNGSQAGAGSPPRPGSALQHAHPNAAGMMRQASGQGGPSRNGTPQLPSGTPAMNNATPIMRQGTPAHSMTQASPVAMNAMAMGTPQMQQAAMQGQMANGVHPNAQAQMAAMRRQQMQNQAMQNQMNGAQMNPQMAANMAQQQAQLERQAAMQQRQQAAMQGTPQPQHMSPNPQSQYNAQLRKQMMQQMGQQGSPGPNQMSPQQMQQMQMMQMQAQAQQQNAVRNQGGQQAQQGQNRGQTNPQMQTVYQSLTMQYFKQAISIEAQKYGGNPGMIPTTVKHQLQQSAGRAAQQHLLKVRQQQQNQQMQNGMMGGQPGNQMMNNNMQMGNMNNNMAAQHVQNQAAIMQQQQRMQNAQAQMQQANYQHQQQMMQQMNQQQHPR